MTPIGGIADAGSIPAISTISDLTTALQGRHPGTATGNVPSQITYDGDVQVSTWWAKKGWWPGRGNLR